MIPNGVPINISFASYNWANDWLFFCIHLLLDYYLNARFAEFMVAIQRNDFIFYIFIDYFLLTIRIAAYHFFYFIFFWNHLFIFFLFFCYTFGITRIRFRHQSIELIFSKYFHLIHSWWNFLFAGITSHFW